MSITTTILRFLMPLLLIPALSVAQENQICDDETGQCMNVNFSPDGAASFGDVEQKEVTEITPDPAPARITSRMPSSISTGGRQTVVFDPNRLAWGAYRSDGQLVKEGRASGGKKYCPDVRRRCKTPIGVFHVYSKGNSSCKSSKYPVGRGGAPMPHCMFFYKGFAIHGSPDVPNHNASHGCIRVPPSDAFWLNRSFVGHGTRVIVRPY